MKRRDFMRLGMMATVWPGLAAGRETGRVRVIGLMTSLPLNDVQWSRMSATKRDLEKLGWIEGHNIRFETRSSYGGSAARAAAARELVNLNPDILMAASTPDTAALLAVTRSIPIVFATAADPVGNGLVESLARPGGNVTGFTNGDAAMGGKWLQYLKEIAPAVVRVGVLFNPQTAPRRGEYFLEPLRGAAASIGVELIAAPLSEVAEIAPIVAKFSGNPASGLILPPDSFTVANRETIVAAIARYRVPTIYSFRYFMAAGGLMSYGPDLEVRSAEYINLILRGARPADLPVQSPRKYELLINLKVAEVLGLKVPVVLLARADRITE